MNTGKFSIGKAYYLLTFVDKDLHIPTIDTYIFLGKNIFNENIPSSNADWYFQTAESYVATGPYDPKEQHASENLLLAGDDMIGDFLSLSGLIKKLQSL